MCLPNSHPGKGDKPQSKHGKNLMKLKGTYGLRNLGKQEEKLT